MKTTNEILKEQVSLNTNERGWMCDIIDKCRQGNDDFDTADILDDIIQLVDYMNRQRFGYGIEIAN